MSTTGHRLLDQIVEAEVESQEMLDKQTGRLDVIQAKLKTLSRSLYKLRVEEKIGKAEAKQMFQAAFVSLMLEEYSHDLPDLVSMTNRHIEEQIAALKEVGAEGLRPIKRDEVKARASAKAKEKAGP